MMYWGSDGPGIGGWLAMILTMLIFWAGLAAVVTFVVREVLTKRPGSTSAPEVRDARAVLDERLARGDIDPEDYQRRRALMVAGDE